MLLHSQHADEQCLYAIALEAVVEIIQEYDTLAHHYTIVVMAASLYSGAKGLGGLRC